MTESSDHTGPLSDSATLADAAILESEGSAIGRYKLLQMIGEGGFGVVYMAEQTEPVTRRVALKIIKLGMDTRQVIARFEAERQALALMDHPNIAKVLDAGSTELGRPYFVMELVKGVPIANYCDDHQLSAEDRLRLFLDVCQAIQHAHQKGIIHRDIKPSNILVTLHDGKPVPKVIDFGIAKATQTKLTEKTLFTRYEQIIGTPAYMSPEQAELSGLDIDTRTDIYSLGVLLYELLTGTTPFDTKQLLSAGLDEMRRIIREQEPIRPSTRVSTLAAANVSRRTLVSKPNNFGPAALESGAESRRPAPSENLIRLLRRDLDWIVLKCLEKDRTRRYETAEGLGRDIARHLNNEPVLARPPSKRYLLNKAFQRHRTAAVFGAVFVSLILTGLFLSLALYRAEKAARLRASAAEREQAELRSRSEAASKSLRETLYASDMMAAQHALAANHRGFARELLRRHLPASRESDLRGWEWRFLWNQAQGDDYATVKIPQLILGSVEASPDGRYIAGGTWTRGRPIYVWDAKSGAQLARWTWHSNDVYSISFSPDSQWLASASAESAALWEAGTWRLMKQFTGGRSPVRFSPDGKRLAVGMGRAVSILAVRDWSVVSSLEPSAVWPELASVAFSADGRLVAFGGPDAVEIHDLDRQRPSVRLRDSSRHSFLSLRFLCFHPDGSSILVGEDDGTINRFDIVSGDRQQSVKAHDLPISSLNISRDGVLSASWDQTIRAWDPNLNPLRTFHGHLSEVWSIALLPSGRSFVSGGKDSTLRFWTLDAPAKERSKRFRLGLPRTEYGFLRVAFHARSQTVAVLPPHEPGQEVQFLSLSTGEVISAFRPPLAQGEFLVGLDSGANWVAARDPAGRFRLWPLSGGEPRALGNHLASFNASPQGSFAGFHSGGGEFELVDLGKGKTVFQSIIPRFLGLFEFSPDESFCAVPSGEDIVVIHIPTGRQTRIPQAHYSNMIIGPVFSPDGRSLATGGADGSTHVWDVQSGARKFSLTGHKQGINSIAFAPDGKSIVTGSDDKTIKLWTAAAGLQMLNFDCTERIQSLFFTPDGTKLIAIGISGNCELFDARLSPRQAKDSSEGDHVRSN